MKRRKWSEIRATYPPETLEGAAELLTSLRLRELREARGLTQAEVADRLEIRQVSVSKLEARSDVRVRTLVATVAAMGGEIEIYARFPDAVYRITMGDDLGVEELGPREMAEAVVQPPRREM